MAAGAVTALIFALVVFSGATEPVITGVVLLAFAASWWLYAALVEPSHRPTPAMGARARRRHGGARSREPRPPAERRS